MSFARRRPDVLSLWRRSVVNENAKRFDNSINFQTVDDNIARA